MKREREWDYKNDKILVNVNVFRGVNVHDLLRLGLEKSRKARTAGGSSLMLRGLGIELQYTRSKRRYGSGMRGVTVRDTQGSGIK